MSDCLEPCRKWNKFTPCNLDSLCPDCKANPKRKIVQKYMKCRICGWESKRMPAPTLIGTLGGVMGCPECGKAKRHPTLECQYGSVHMVYERHRHKERDIKYLGDSIVQGCEICPERRLVFVNYSRPKYTRWMTQLEAIKHNLSWLWRY